MLMKFSLCAGLACAVWGCSFADAQESSIGKRFPPERRTLKDERTGLTLTQLTTAEGSDDKIYQTHPQWTADAKYIVFRSSGRSQGQQVFAYSEATGEIIQLTEGVGNATGSLNLSRKANKVWFFRNVPNFPRVMVELNLETLLADSAAGKMKPAASYERIITLSDQTIGDSGGFGVDADEQFAVMGISHGPPPALTGSGDTPRPATPDAEQKVGGLRKLDLKTGEVTTILDVPFRMGHVQCSPFVPGEIMYCHETGGDAPQRMWFIKADGTGNKKLYEENPDDWISHEVFVSNDVVMFNMIAHLPRLNRHPAGIAMVNVRDDSMRLLAQIPTGRGYWHVAGTPDLKWAAADNFIGELYSVNVATGEQKLLTAGHAPNAAQIPAIHTHHNYSPDFKRILFNTGMFGNSDLMTVDLPAVK